MLRNITLSLHHNNNIVTQLHSQKNQLWFSSECLKKSESLLDLDPVTYIRVLFLVKILLIYFWLHWVSVSGFSLRDFSCGRAWALGVWASVVVAQGLSCSAACGIFPDQELNLCPLHS